MNKHPFKEITLFMYLIVSACSNEERSSLSNRSDKKFMKNDIQIDSVMLPLPEKFSGLGIIEILRDSLFFADRSYEKLTSYDFNGAIGKSYLGKGEGPLMTKSAAGNSQLKNRIRTVQKCRLRGHK